MTTLQSLAINRLSHLSNLTVVVDHTDSNVIVRGTLNVPTIYGRQLHSYKVTIHPDGLTTRHIVCSDI